MTTFSPGLAHAHGVSADTATGIMPVAHRVAGLLAFRRS
jgi:hypothetical protein